MDDLATEHSFDLQVFVAIDVLGLFFDILLMGVCTTRHWQTSNRLVQELHVCTVCVKSIKGDVFILNQPAAYG